MADIQTLVPPAEPGWRVAVATAYYPDGAAQMVTYPLVGWAKVNDLEVGVYWTPAWWDELGLSTGYPGQIAWPLGPGEVLESDLECSLRDEATADYLNNQKGRQRGQ